VGSSWNLSETNLKRWRETVRKERANLFGEVFVPSLGVFLRKTMDRKEIVDYVADHFEVIPKKNATKKSKIKPEVFQ